MRKLYETQLREAKTCESINTAVAISLDNDSPRIYDIVKNGNNDILIAYVVSELSSFCAMIPANRSATPEAVIAMGKAFAENPDVKNLSFIELKTFLSLALKRMKFGKLYGGFGYDTLIDWFEQFQIERINSIIDYREAKHNQYTSNEKTTRKRIEGDAFGSNSINEIINNNRK